MLLTGFSLLTMALLAVAGVALDLLLGEPRRWHPLVGFGRVAGWLEQYLNRGRQLRLRGGAAWLLAVLPPVLMAYGILHSLSGVAATAAAIGHVLLLYFAVGLRSLRDHTAPIAAALAEDDLDSARALTGRIVSRDTHTAGASDLAKAGVESLLENGNDAVFGALFWFAVAGGPGALLFRLANTLDAMWGYRNDRFHAFGFAAARLDDGFNLAPARITAVLYAVLGDARAALYCWRTQAGRWASPNAGPVMAAGAGSLGVMLGGAAMYDGALEVRPLLGCGRQVCAADIMLAWRLVLRTAFAWLLLLIVVGLVM